MQKSADRQMWIVAFFVAVACVIMMRNRNHTFHAMYSKPQRVMKMVGVITAAYLLGKGSQYLYLRSYSPTDQKVHQTDSDDAPMGGAGGFIDVPSLPTVNWGHANNGGDVEPGPDNKYKYRQIGIGIPFATVATAAAAATVANGMFGPPGSDTRKAPDDDVAKSYGEHYQLPNNGTGWRKGGAMEDVDPNDGVDMENFALKQCPVQQPHSFSSWDTLFVNLLTSG
jgi:hypothetical protein